jgi:1,4-dihydroxy-2-naphthoate octaprenyltransferase
VSGAQGVRDWLAATRPRTLTAAVVPVALGVALAGRAGPLDAAVAMVTLAAAVLIQVTTNFANDWFDARHGADGPDRLGPARLSAQSASAAAAIGRGTIVVLAGAAVAGLYLVWHGGWPVLLIGVVSLTCAVAYTGGPFPLAYHGLGDVFVLVFFGPVAVGGTYLLQRGTLPAAVLLASLPVGLLATAILMVNNLRDVDGDARAGKRTLAVRFGRRATRAGWIGAVATALVLAVVVVGWPALLAVPVAAHETRALLACHGRALNASLAGTARLHLIVGLLLVFRVMTT